MSYEGYENYNTWAVKLWMDNEEPSYRYWKEEAERIYKDAEPRFDWETTGKAATYDLARALEAHHEELSPLTDSEPTVYTDLLSSALRDVDWYEIATVLISEYLESIEYEKSKAVSS